MGDRARLRGRDGSLRARLTTSRRAGPRRREAPRSEEPAPPRHREAAGRMICERAHGASGVPGSSRVASWGHPCRRSVLGAAWGLSGGRTRLVRALGGRPTPVVLPQCYRRRKTVRVYRWGVKIVPKGSSLSHERRAGLRPAKRGISSSWRAARVCRLLRVTEVCPAPPSYQLRPEAGPCRRSASTPLVEQVCRVTTRSSAREQG